MARTIKRGLDYFPFDIDFFQDIRIRKLIKYQSGKAVAVYAFLLCNIYRNGYYAEWDKELPFIISEQTGYTEAYIQEVIECCMNIGLFSKELFDSHHVLTSRGIQQRYLRICSSSRRSVRIKDYSLIDSETSAAPSPGSHPSTEKKPTQTEPQPPIKTNPQPSPSPQTYSMTPDREIAILAADSRWLQGVSTRYAISVDEIIGKLSEFSLTCSKNHTSLQDCKSHFCRWLAKQSPRPSSQPRKAIREDHQEQQVCDSAAQLRSYLKSRGLQEGTSLAALAASEAAASIDNPTIHPKLRKS